MAGFERGVRPMGDWSISMTLSSASVPKMVSCLPAASCAPLKHLRQFLVENVNRQGRFAGTRDACDGDELAKRNFDINLFEIVFAGSLDGQKFAIALPPLFRYLNFALAADKLSGDGFWILGNLVTRARGNDMPAVFACARSQVNDVIRRG